MIYNFNLTPTVPLTLVDLDVATDATLVLGQVSFTPTGELNDDQMTTAIAAVEAAVLVSTGLAVTASLGSIQA